MWLPTRSCYVASAQGASTQSVMSRLGDVVRLWPTQNPTNRFNCPLGPTFRQRTQGVLQNLLLLFLKSAEDRFFKLTATKFRTR